MFSSAHKLTIENIEILITRKTIKNLRLAIYPPDGDVYLSAPRHLSDEFIHLAILKKIDWIKKKQVFFQQQSRGLPLSYLSGERHFFRGNSYLLQVLITKERPGVVLKDDSIIMTVPPDASLLVKAKLLDEWYRQELKKIIPQIIKIWEPIMNKTVKAWGVKKMKTRWGTCNPKAERIWLSLELAKKSQACLEYVIVHEMVHFFETKHNANFKGKMDCFLPNWRLYKRQLNGLEET